MTPNHRPLHSSHLHLLILGLAFWFAPLGGAQAFEPPTMLVMNSPTAKARIEKGAFRPVFRGIGLRTPLEIAKTELLAFRFLLDTDCLSTTLRELVQANLARGMAPDAALLKAKQDNLEVLKKEFTTMASTEKLYENAPGKDCVPEYSFLFTTPHLALAACYGPVVLVIEEVRPRGLDLNGIAQDAHYYSIGRFLQNLANLRLKSIGADYLLDRDEYVIPSFIPPEDITGVIVFAPSKIVVNKRLPLIPPKVMRVYRKRHLQGTTVIDVFDGKDRLIERLSLAPAGLALDPEQARSPERLPTAIAEAWKQYVAKRLLKKK
ncbi:MAG: hypothetical protein OZSIB_4024 [Candidatus Ozemobacter sibiricus]|jgi:hypothetical protein|uniref:Uncharacterized protein n=1 Tax=Candidatus Ozemobacter sibiricus TaxID=2268124 RepID=A0A367ZPA9_9BACT|nr:MAG: hypothetical protein OZSIB_4024 [Candidatus Ozemobacter sibiricus]